MRAVQERPRNYVAMYGNVKIEKQWCDDCDGYSFVVDERLVCCDARASGMPAVVKREAEPDMFRSPLKNSDKRRKLEEQDHRCLYCNRRFGSVVYRHGKPIRLRVHYDHMVPVSYSGNNLYSNFAAACHVCNLMKADMCFQTVEEAQIYLLDRWDMKGYC